MNEINLMRPVRHANYGARYEETEAGMGKVIGGAILGSLVGVFFAALLLRQLGAGHSEMPQADAWPSVLQAELRIADPLRKEGIATLVALSEELYWLRRAQADRRGSATLFQRNEGKPQEAEDGDERALRFLIEQVSASLERELDRWQEQIGRISTLGAAESNAMLRILAFAKWQQKGGAYQYAYEFFQQLSRNTFSEPKLATPHVVLPTPTPTNTSRPTEALPTATKRPKKRTPAPTEAAASRGVL